MNESQCEPSSKDKKVKKLLQITRNLHDMSVIINKELYQVCSEAKHGTNLCRNQNKKKLTYIHHTCFTLIYNRAFKV